MEVNPVVRRNRHSCDIERAFIFIAQTLYHTRGVMGNSEPRQCSLVGGDVRIVVVKSWVEISKERLAGNYRVLSGTAGVPVLAVVKADGYGHGAAGCGVVLAGAGAEWLGVMDAAEGIAVREAVGDACRFW